MTDSCSGSFKTHTVLEDETSEVAQGKEILISEKKDGGFQFSENHNFETLRKMMENFVDDRDWQKYHTPRNLLLALVGEVGELAELFQWRGEVAVGIPDWTDAERQHLKEELSDVLLYLIALANKCHVDLPTAAVEKMTLNGKKYPIEKVYGSSKKYTELK